MGAESKIGWTNHTFNPWWGCVRVSPGCKFCYADTFAKSVGHKVWGEGAPRRFFTLKHWGEPLKWNAAAKKKGRPALVFCASMADVFEVIDAARIAEVEADGRADDAKLMRDTATLLDAERARLWTIVEHTDWLIWLFLSKRPENGPALVPPRWMAGAWPRNAWVGATIENGEQAALRLPALFKMPAPVRFASCEPLLGPVDLCAVNDGSWHDREGADRYNALTGTSWWSNGDTGVGGGPHLDWVIVGGESGKGRARKFRPEWARSIVKDCRDAGVPVFVKQMGDACDVTGERFDDWPGGVKSARFVDAAWWRADFTANAGTDPSEWPADLRVQEWPAARDLPPPSGLLLIKDGKATPMPERGAP